MPPRRPPLDPETVAPSVSWEQLADGMGWRQGEHVSLIGPTGTGKTHLALSLLEQRAWVTVLGTKPKDRTLDQLRRRKRFHLLRTWQPTVMQQRLILWPKVASIRDHSEQREVFATAMDQMFAAGGWTLFADELSWLCEQLKMEKLLKAWWQQGRSSHLTLVGATQRPAWVPLDVYSAATHLFFWRTNDDADLRRIGGLNGHDPSVVRELVRTLDAHSHQFLYVNTRTGLMSRSVAPARP